MKPNTELHIIVAGRPKTGKTTLAFQLKELLEANGFPDVEYRVEASEEWNAARVLADIGGRVAAMKQAGVKVVIQERQMDKAGNLGGEVRHPWMIF